MKIRSILIAGLIGLLSLVSCSASPVVDHIRASLIRLEAVVPLEGTKVCTGFVIAPDTVLTAAHCMGPLLTADGVEATLIHGDEYFDLAVISTKTGKHPLTIRSKPVYLGEPLRGTGYAWGWSIPLSMKQTVLIPSYSPAAKIVVGIITQGGYEGGMSGGPITDMNGDVVGVVQRHMDNTGYGVGEPIIRAFLLDSGIEVN